MGSRHEMAKSIIHEPKNEWMKTFLNNIFEKNSHTNELFELAAEMCHILY